MSTIVTRAGKGAPLTHNEVDANFNNLNTDKVEKTAAAITGGSINGTTIGASTPSTGSFTSLTDSGNLTFTGTGNRITGDFTNATASNRVLFQTSTTNFNTSVGIIPNGTATSSLLELYNNSTDLANVSRLNINISSTEATLRSAISGTGTYLPLTMWTGGSERLRIDTSGNAMIGTTSAGGKFTVTQATAGATATVINGVASRFTFDYLGGGNNYFDGASILFRDFAGTEKGSLAMGATTALRITSPTGYSVFTINSATGSAAYLDFTVNSTTTARLWSDSNSVLAFTTGSSNTERMRIDNSGNVGIGLTPSYRLDVNRGSVGDVSRFTNGVDATLVIGAPTGGITYNQLNGGYQAWQTAGTERMRIDSSGNVSIGTASAYTTGGVTAKLSINGAVRVNGYLGIDGNTYFSNGTGEQMLFTVSSAERMRIDGSGNVGIGTSSTSGIRLGVDSGSSALNTNFNSTNASGVYVRFQNSGTSIGDIGSGANAISGGTAGDFALTSRSGNLVFGTGSAERMRIDANGLVGIGTSSPSQPLQITKSQNASTWVYVTNGSNGAGAASGVLFDTDLGNAGAISQNSSGNTSPAANALRLRNLLSAPITFEINSTERMRLTSAGSLLVGCTAAPQSGVRGVQLGETGYIRTGADTTATRGHIAFNNPNGEVGLISTTGTSTTYATSSDYRLKENIAPMTGALAKVAQLKPVTYTWKADGSDGQGFIAHELAEVCPDAVTGEKDAVDEDGNPKYQGIDVSFLVATLTAAIKEQQAMIEELKAKVAALEAQ